MSRLSHKSNAEELINALPIVEVDGDTARCLGVHALGFGHPVQYIQLNKRQPGEPETCKWCGLRFKQKHGHHWEEKWAYNNDSERIERGKLTIISLLLIIPNI